jgi:hypothetical protein
MDVRVEIKNMPKHVQGYVVAIRVFTVEENAAKQTLWYYGCYTHKGVAEEEAMKVDGIVLEVIRSWE